VSLERLALAGDLSICRLLNGMWQVSGGHGRIDRAKALESMHAHAADGFTTWDLADHYGPAEDLVGAYRRRHSSQPGGLSNLQFFTKWVPRPGQMSGPIVADAVALSQRRMESDTLDLLQFHWWDYADRRYLDALARLTDMRDAGAVRHLGLTNFDTERLADIVEREIAIVSNQVQFSIIDRRPEVRMAPWCREHGVHLLAYGAVCGGLLSDKYLGQPEPRGAALDTVSLQKYKRMVDAWGGWGLFQDLLTVLKSIAARQAVSIATVSARWVLDRPAVAGVILGRRLGLTDHRAENAAVFAVTLDAEDLARIDQVGSKSHDLFRSIGDCGDEYRRT
jgi:aryl-alcohol dehydrogenase-like predicted oxidoreductase